MWRPLCAEFAVRRPPVLCCIFSQLPHHTKFATKHGTWLLSGLDFQQHRVIKNDRGWRVHKIPQIIDNIKKIVVVQYRDAEMCIRSEAASSISLSRPSRWLGGIRRAPVKTPTSSMLSTPIYSCHIHRWKGDGDAVSVRWKEVASKKSTAKRAHDCCKQEALMPRNAYLALLKTECCSWMLFTLNVIEVKLLSSMHGSEQTIPSARCSRYVEC